MFKALSGKVTWAEFDGRGDQFRGDFLFSKNPAMDVLLKKILFFLSGIVFLLVMNDSIDRAVFQPFRKAESEKDSSMSSNGINLYADTVFVKKVKPYSLKKEIVRSRSSISRSTEKTSFNFRRCWLRYVVFSSEGIRSSPS